MKKVGIVSCYFKNNYGSMLQAYATKKILDNNNIPNETITIGGNKDFKKRKTKIGSSTITDSKKKVLFMTPTGNFSGAESVNLSIINEIKEKYNVIYICKPGKMIDICIKNKINYILVKKLNLKTIYYILKKEKPDIIHCQDFKMSFLCAICKKREKLIIHLHNNPFWLSKISANSIGLLFSCIRSDKVFIVSKSIQNEFIFSKFVKKKMINIGNPLSTKKILKSIKKKENSLLYDVCCCGRLTDQKDPYRFINIISELQKKYPSLKVIWIGDGFEKDKYISYAKEKKAQIEFCGFKSNPYEIMHNSKVFMLTSKYEGFGLVAFEALTLGLPVVVSNVGGLVSVVDDTCGKLCNTDDDFEQEILKLLNNDAYYSQKKANAIKKSKELDNLSSYIRTVIKYYEQ